MGMCDAKFAKYASSLAILIWSMGLVSCGISQDTQMLTIEMLAADIAPEGASGTEDPIYLTLTPVSVVATNQSTDAAIALSLGYEFEELTIIDRSQIIFETELTDYEGVSLVNLTVNLEAAYKAAGKTVAEKEASLTTTEIVYAGPETVETGKDLSFQITLSWGDILSEDSLGQPAFSIEKL